MHILLNFHINQNTELYHTTVHFQKFGRDVMSYMQQDSLCWVPVYVSCSLQYEKGLSLKVHRDVGLHIYPACDIFVI